MSDVEPEIGPDPFSDEAIIAKQAQQPRDEAGRFVGQHEPAETEEEVTDDGDAPVADDGGEVRADTPLLLGKFKTPEELAQAYEALEAHLGEQGLELGRLRKIEEKLDSLAQPQSAIPQLPGNFEAILETNPGYAVQLAYEAGATHELQAAFAVWQEDDPASAYMWWSDQRVAAATKDLEARLEERLAPFREQSAQVEKQTAAQEVAAAYAALTQRYPDFEDVSKLMPDMARRAPEIVEALKRPGSQERVLENLYWMARGQRADELAAAQQQRQQEQAQQSQEERAQATVASATATSQAAARPVPDWKQQIKQSILQGDMEYDEEMPAFARGNL